MRDAMLDVKCNGFVTEFVDEIAFPIPLQASRQQSIKKALQGGEGHGTQQSKIWRSKLTDRTVNLLGLVERSCVRPNNATHSLGMQGLRKGRAGWDFQEGKETIQILGGLGHEVPIPAHHIGSLIHFPENWAAKHHFYRLGPKHETT